MSWKVSAALMAVSGAMLSSNVKAQDLPPTVAQPVQAWRACVEEIINRPYLPLSQQLRRYALQGCPEWQRRTEDAINALPNPAFGIETIEQYIEQIVQQAYDRRQAAARPPQAPGTGDHLALSTILGLEVRSRTSAEVAQAVARWGEAQMPLGVIVTAVDRSKDYSKTLSVGSFIFAVNNASTPTPEAFWAALEDSRRDGASLVMINGCSRDGAGAVCTTLRLQLTAP